jgi:hypothetical protein
MDANNWLSLTPDLMKFCWSKSGVNIAPLVSTAHEETGFLFLNLSMSQFAPGRKETFDGRMAEDLLNGEQFDVEDGCYGKILAPLNC